MTTNHTTTSKRTKDLSGQRFGRLQVIAQAANDSENRAVWRCRCDCGGTRDVKAANLMRGETRSCGCLGRETRKRNGDKAGVAQAHPFSKSAMLSEYRTWEAMLARCYRPDAQGFANYGGRGIEVCVQWRESFEQFARDMGPRPAGHSIERKQNDGNYEPDNCRWATRIEQANNRRTNRRISVDGQTMTVAQWARHLGVSCHVIHTRIYIGMDAVEAVRKSMHHQPK